MTEGAVVEYTIPACLADGFYLVRHETIALHAAYSYPGAQVYPGCHQLEVTGGGSTVPSSLVGFPGAYKATDPGITYDAYKGEYFCLDVQAIESNECVLATEYVIPGPAVFKC